MPSEMSKLSAPVGGLSFSFWQTWWYFNLFANKSQQKNGQKLPKFWPPLVILSAPKTFLLNAENAEKFKNDNQTQSTLIRADFQLCFYLSDICGIGVKKQN